MPRGFEPTRRFETVLSSYTLVVVYEPVGGGVVSKYRLIPLEFVLDGFGQLFAQFHTHLVK